LLLCIVIGLADGDTLTARCADQTIKVRLSEIDAPEKAQAWGQRSKESLAALCFNKPAQIRTLNKDRYGRTVGRVFCDGVDANLEQVRSGMAWAYTRYLTDASVAEAEKSARTARLGLWSDPQPTPPWEWRRRSRGEASARASMHRQAAGEG
jgi:endonuclease YncB( thermonuclease family)